MDAHDAEQPDEPLLGDGNAVRLRACFPLGLGTLLGVLALASAASPRFVVPVAAVAVALVVFGVLDLIGSFDDAASHVVEGRTLAWPLLRSILACVAFWGLMVAGVDGRLSVVVSAIAFPASFIACVAALHGVGRALGPWRDRALTDRHGFWLVSLAALLYLPMLGNHALWDPWETHYGEVAREVLARNDWISLWWAQDGWFWSKPVLTFWMQALAMALTGVRYEPGSMLSAVAEGRLAQPEWPLRMTVFLCAVVGVYLLYKAVARSHGRRAGFLGGVVLLTMPQFFLLARQTMTDMPFAAFMAAAMGCFALAAQTSDDERVRVYRVRLGFAELSLSLFHLVFAALLLVVVPQILYLVSRNVGIALSPHADLRFVADSFAGGSPGNCGLPGNGPCDDGLRPLTSRLEPVVQALLWLQCVSLVLWLEWGERRQKRILYLAAWLFVSLATMAKGPAGIGLPVIAALAWVIATGRWRELTRMEVIAGALVFAALVLPWFVAMYVRHGQPFTDRLLFHDMFKRAFQHVHDTNEGEDVSFRYYVWQLGYATFPWVGLVPIAAVRWLRRRDGVRFDTELLMGAWFVLGFALFSVMGTKFHHYALPLLPPLAMLSGIMLADASRREVSHGGRLLLGASVVVAAIVTLTVGRDLAWQADARDGPIRLLHLITYNYARVWPEHLRFDTELWVFTIAAALATAAIALAPIRRHACVALLVVCTAFAAWTLDVYMVTLSPHWGQRELFIAYERHNAREPGPSVAYQLNWKGENFYRGNQVPAFVSSGKVFQDWVAAEKKAGVRVFYFVTEHKRIGSLKSELGNPHVDELSDERLNNKFVLVRVRF